MATFKFSIGKAGRTKACPKVTCYHLVTVNLDCHLNRILTHLGDKALGYLCKGVSRIG